MAGLTALSALLAGVLAAASPDLPAAPTSEDYYGGGPCWLVYGGDPSAWGGKYLVPGYQDSWVFNRAMVWANEKAAADAPPLCYCDRGPLLLTGRRQVSRWYAAQGDTLADVDEHSTRFVLRGRIGHACLPPLQFNLDQHPTAMLEVAKATRPWRLLVKIKGRHGLPMYVSPWKEGPGRLTVNLREIYRRKGYTNHYPELLFLLTTATGLAADEAEIDCQMQLESAAAVIASLPVIRTAQRAGSQGVPLLAVVVDEQARRLSADQVAVSATVGTQKVELAEVEKGLWKAVVTGLAAGDYTAGITARWKSAPRSRTSRLEISITDGKFLAYDRKLKLLTSGGKPIGPIGGGHHGKVLFRHVDQPQESFLRGQADWDRIHAGPAAPDYDWHWWDSHTEAEIDKQCDYWRECGWTALHLDQWFGSWERLDCAGRLAPHGTEQLATMLRAARRNGLWLYFNLSDNTPQGQPAQPYAQYHEAGADLDDTRPGSVFMKLYCRYAGNFAEMFRDETALLGCSAAGERDSEGTRHNGGAAFVNAVCEAYGARDPNHLFLCEPHMFFNRPPNYYRAAWKPILGGFRTYFVDWTPALRTPEAATVLFKLAAMGDLFMAEGVNFSFPVFSNDWGCLEKPPVMANYRLRCRQHMYTGLVYRLPIVMTWEDCVVEDERQVFQEVRRRVDWSQPFRTPKLAIRVGQKLLPPSNPPAKPLWDLQRLLGQYPLESVYVWEDDALPPGTIFSVDARKALPEHLSFASDGGSLPDALTEQMPLRLPAGMTASYSSSEDGGTLLAFLRKKGAEELIWNTADAELQTILPKPITAHDVATGKWPDAGLPLRPDWGVALPFQFPKGRAGSTWAAQEEQVKAILARSVPVGGVGLRNFPSVPLYYRLYDLAGKRVVQEGRFSRAQSLKIPDVGWDFFVLVTPQR